jgi:hypothetical protein
MLAIASSKVHLRSAVGGAVNNPVFLTVTHQDIGKSYLRAFGEVILAERLSGEYCPRDFLPDDVGRRIYFFPPDQIAIEPVEQQLRREAFFAIHYLCQLLGWTVWASTSSGPFALGEPGLKNVTPWYESLIQLEEYCQVNVDRFRRQVSVH